MTQSSFAFVLLTIAAFWVGQDIHRRSGGFPLFTPLLVGIVLVATVLSIANISFDQYHQATSWLHVLLGPATVALAIPIYKRRSQLASNPIVIAAAIFFGSLSSVVSAILTLKIFGASSQSVLSMLPKSITTPVAMQVSGAIGGVPPVTAMIVILTGAVGYCLGPTIFRILHVNDPMVRGLAYGTCSHVLGSAKAIEEGETTAAFAALAMASNALMSALALPVIFQWLR
jgi:predicted murein hydrolase (TIGR00659 family)